MGLQDKKDYIVYLFFITLSILFYSLFFTNQRDIRFSKNPYHLIDDTISLWLPIVEQDKKCIKNLHIPQWIPNIESGKLFGFFPHNPIFYPPFWIFFVFQFKIALLLYITFHTFLSLYTSYRLNIRFSRKKTGAILGSIIYTFSSLPIAFSKHISIYPAIALAPLAIELFISKRYFKTSMVLILYMLIGDFQTFLYITEFLILVSIVRYKKYALRLTLLAIVVPILIFIPKIYNTFLLYKESIKTIPSQNILGIENIDITNIFTPNIILERAENLNIFFIPGILAILLGITLTYKRLNVIIFIVISIIVFITGEIGELTFNIRHNEGSLFLLILFLGITLNISINKKYINYLIPLLAVNTIISYYLFNPPYLYIMLIALLMLVVATIKFPSYSLKKGVSIIILLGNVFPFSISFSNMHFPSKEESIESNILNYLKNQRSHIFFFNYYDIDYYNYIYIKYNSFGISSSESLTPKNYGKLMGVFCPFCFPQKQGKVVKADFSYSLIYNTKNLNIPMLLKFFFIKTLAFYKYPETALETIKNALKKENINLKLIVKDPNWTLFLIENAPKFPLFLMDRKHSELFNEDETIITTKIKKIGGTKGLINLMISGTKEIIPHLIIWNEKKLKINLFSKKDGILVALFKPAKYLNVFLDGKKIKSMVFLKNFVGIKIKKGYHKIIIY